MEGSFVRLYLSAPSPSEGEDCRQTAGALISHMKVRPTFQRSELVSNKDCEGRMAKPIFG